jgi:endogenous inhibitor of DNA gyrase (YacG/DUF329 family)
MTHVTCPTCKKEVEWSEKSIFRPFCSERCQLIDLSAWSNEAYRVPVTPQTEDELIQLHEAYSTIQ